MARVAIRPIALFAAVALVATVAAAPASAHGSTLSIVARGLNNPRGLAIGPNGALYVAEAGKGGDDACMTGPEGEVCFGRTGAITRIWHGHKHRIVRGLPSGAEKDTGRFAIGPSDVALLGIGNLYATIGLGADPAVRSSLPGFGRILGQLVRVNQPRHRIWKIADIAGFEARVNPDGGAVDSNPQAVAAYPGGHLVVDAGGNSLIKVRANRRISTVATFPDELVPAPPFLGLPPGTMIPMQAVPTSIVRGPDGAWYVGLLTGFPFPVGGARVYRIVPGHAPTVYAEGFTNIIDIAFGRDGSLWVLEIAHNGLLSGDEHGALIRVRPNGTRETLLTDTLINPGGMTIGRNGAIYISNYGTYPSLGQVLRYKPSH